MTDFAINLTRLMRTKGKTPHDFYAHPNPLYRVPKTTLFELRHNISIPEVKTAEKIAKVLGLDDVRQLYWKNPTKVREAFIIKERERDLKKRAKLVNTDNVLNALAELDSLIQESETERQKALSWLRKSFILLVIVFVLGAFILVLLAK